MNSPRFTRFTLAHQPGDVFVRPDAVTSVAEIDYSSTFLATPPGKPRKATAISTGGYGMVYVKESPAQVIEALSAAGDTKDVSIEIVMPDEEPVGLRALIDDINNLQEIALLMEQRDEALDDAKIADERAEWYRKRVEQLLDEKASNLMACTRVSVERDQLLAKLRETTAALDKANCELNAARYYTLGSGYRRGENVCIGNVASAR